MPEELGIRMKTTLHYRRPYGRMQYPPTDVMIIEMPRRIKSNDWALYRGMDWDPSLTPPFRYWTYVVATSSEKHLTQECPKNWVMV